MEGKTQDEVSQIAGTSRARVQRTLLQSRADGTVQIRVTFRLSHCVELESELGRKYGFCMVKVVPSPEDPGDVSEIIGREPGEYLSQAIGPDMTVRFGWGRPSAPAFRASSRASAAARR